MRIYAAASAAIVVLAAVSVATFLAHQRLPALDPGLVPVTVEIRNGQTLLVARHEVTIAEWQRCFEEGGCSHLPKPGFGATGTGFPVTGVNWFDVNEYVSWDNLRSDRPVRLPTLAEWNSISYEVPFKSGQNFSLIRAWHGLRIMEQLVRLHLNSSRAAASVIHAMA